MANRQRTGGRLRKTTVLKRKTKIAVGRTLEFTRSPLCAFYSGLLVPPMLWASVNAVSTPAIAKIPEKPVATFEMASFSPGNVRPSQTEPTGHFVDHTGYRPPVDSAVESIYRAMSAHKLNEALTEADALLERYPNFSLGHMLRGDILSLKAGRPIGTIGDMTRVPKKKKQRLEQLRQEAVARFKAANDRPSRDLLPSELVVLDNAESYVVLIDTGRSRLFLYENSFPHPRLVTDFYISQGKRGAVKHREGDNKTPIGVYTITEYLPDEKLPELYGPLALPIDYPNAWDKRLGKTGYGIWLHGMPRKYVSRPPLDSEGCVVLSNEDIVALKQFVDIGDTQVVISENLDFVPTDVWQVQRRSALRVVKRWKDDLERGFDRSLVHYAQNVKVNGSGLFDWQKKMGANNTALGEMNLSGLNVFKYPNPDREMMRVTFERNDSLGASLEVEQYWMKVGTRWKIVQEQSTSL